MGDRDLKWQLVKTLFRRKYVLVGLSAKTLELC